MFQDMNKLLGLQTANLGSRLYAVHLYQMANHNNILLSVYIIKPCKEKIVKFGGHI